MASPLTLERLQTYLDNSPFIAFMRMRAKSVDPEQERVDCGVYLLLAELAGQS